MCHDLSATSLDRKNPAEKDLDALCKLLPEEGKHRVPKHQRWMELLKAKMAGRERNIDFLERVHKMIEVAEVESITPDELGIHIFAESVDPTMAKLELDVLSQEVPTITKLMHIVRSTEV